MLRFSCGLLLQGLHPACRHPEAPAHRAPGDMDDTGQFFGGQFQSLFQPAKCLSRGPLPDRIDRFAGRTLFRGQI